jgi:16S rRNA (cytosine967-C5)-methyltransferase
MKHDVVGVPLWRQLQATASVVAAVRDGASGTAAVEAVSTELRPGVQALAFHVWRNLGRAEALRDLLVKKRPPAVVDALLCIALALAWQEDQAPYDAFTLVNQTVEAAKRTHGSRPHANFLNACLRRFLRERNALVAQTDSNPVALWNHPLWWVRKLQAERPLHWQDILRAANSHAPMALRVNRRRASPESYLETLTHIGVAAKLDPSGAVLLERAVPVTLLPGFSQGDVSVQDAAAQLAAGLLLKELKGSKPQKILDACAAPGGKTGHLLELTDGDVTALEIDAERSKRIQQNLDRLGLSAKVLTGNAAHLDAWWDGIHFDAILLDAPCTASGIVRRHPDVRWLRREADIAQLARLQKELLQVMWRVLKPGGHLLYCTCSLFKAEGEHQAQTFLANNNNAVLLPSPGHLMPQNGANGDVLTDNQPGNHDGFFYALFHKQPE